MNIKEDGEKHETHREPFNLFSPSETHQKSLPFPSFPVRALVLQYLNLCRMNGRSQVQTSKVEAWVALQRQPVEVYSCTVSMVHLDQWTWFHIGIYLATRKECWQSFSYITKNVGMPFNDLQWLLQIIGEIDETSGHASQHQPSGLWRSWLPFFRQVAAEEAMHPCCMKLWALATWDTQGTRFKHWSIGLGWFGFSWKWAKILLKAMWHRPSWVQWWHPMHQKKWPNDSLSNWLVGRQFKGHAFRVAADSLIECNDVLGVGVVFSNTRESLKLTGSAMENGCHCRATAQQLQGAQRILHCGAASWGSQDPEVALSRQPAHCGDSHAAKCTLLQPLQLDLKTTQMELKWFSHFPVMSTSALRL